MPYLDETIEMYNNKKNVVYIKKSWIDVYACCYYFTKILIFVVLFKWLNSQYKVITSDFEYFSCIHFNPLCRYSACSHFQPLCPPRSSKPRVGGSQVRDFPKNHQFLLEDLIEITLWYFICESRGILWFYRIQVRPLPCLVCKSVSPCSLLELIHGFVKTYVWIFFVFFIKFSSCYM